tara:strand:+ start:142 stop:321 length:180 start_codon:yes stop_codon:yes gene_type:complete
MATQSHEERTPKTQAKHKSEKFICNLSKDCLLLFVMFPIIIYYRQKSIAFLRKKEKKAK